MANLTVLLTFQILGTAPDAAVQKYLNAKHVPQLFASTGATLFTDPRNCPWTMGYNPNYQTRAARGGAGPGGRAPASGFRNVAGLPGGPKASRSGAADGVLCVGVDGGMDSRRLRRESGTASGVKVLPDFPWRA